jgi:hypothetical protein
MMDDFKSEKWTLEDGRRAERRVVENKLENGQSERVIELHVEDERPLRLQQRVIEKTKPIVFERRTEIVDPQNGSVLEQKVESIEPKVKMQLVDHIVKNNQVDAQSVPSESNVLKEEMVDTLVAAIKAKLDSQSVQNPNFSGKLKTFGLADEVAERVQNKFSTKDMLLMGVVAAQIIGLIYILFFM